MAKEPGQENRDPYRNESKLRLSHLVRMAIVGAILLVAMLWVWVQPSNPTEKKDFIQAVGVLIAGLAGFVGLYFTWINLDQTRQTTQRTLELTEKGQITERFTRAIDQLGATDDDGNPRLEIRVGGIYALERIDKESPRRAYHGTVMEVLTAYVRENAPWPPKSSESSEAGFVRALAKKSVSDAEPHEAAKKHRNAEQDAELARRTPSNDIRAILHVLERREEDLVPEEHRVQYFDLQGADLRGANLSYAHLEGANLSYAHLEGANLSYAHLEGANLSFAHLERAVLDLDYLEGASAHLEEADLSNAHLEGAVLSNTYLERANLNLAHLEGADLTNAHLEGAILGLARLKGAIGLIPEQIEWTFGDDVTELPEHLIDHRPPVWSKSSEEQYDIIEKRLR